jgi:hypothetical protein
MPNAMLLKNPVWVRTDRAVRRTTILCCIALDEDVAAAPSSCWPSGLRRLTGPGSRAG